MYQNLEAILLFSSLNHAHRQQNEKARKKSSLLLVGFHRADISSSPENRMALTFFFFLIFNFCSVVFNVFIFYIIWGKTEAAQLSFESQDTKQSQSLVLSAVWYKVNIHPQETTPVYSSYSFVWTDSEGSRFVFLHYKVIKL